MNIRSLIGPVLIILGVLLFFNPGKTFGVGTIFTYFWPSMFVIPVGILLHWLYFIMTDRRGVGLLIPGGILVTAGIVCQISMLFHAWSYMWPGFILAVAVGLVEFYWFGGRNRWMLIPISILTTLSLLFFAVFSIGELFSHSFLGQPTIAVALIVAGALMLLIQKNRA